MQANGPGPGVFNWGDAFTNSYNPGRGNAPGNVGAANGNNGQVIIYYDE